MHYKVTKQYSRSVETLIAEFSHVNDAKSFIARKSAIDASMNAQIVYRIFHHFALHSEFNKDKINTPMVRGQYASGDHDLPHAYAYRFKVTKRMAQEAEVTIAAFTDANDPEVFVETQTNATYRIYEGDKLLNENKPAVEIPSEGSQGKQSTATFRPTPFTSVPRPGPAKWLKDEEKDSTDKK